MVSTSVLVSGNPESILARAKNFNYISNLTLWTFCFKQIGEETEVLILLFFQFGLLYLSMVGWWCRAESLI